MAVDKLVDSTQLDADLTSVANAIRTKGGTSASLTFPAGFVSAVEAIPTGGGGWTTEGIAARTEPNGDIEILGSTISGYAFYMCREIENVSAKNVTSLGTYAFEYCTKLGTVRLDVLKTMATNNYSFAYAGTTSRNAIVVLPSLTSIGSRMFTRGYFEAIDIGPDLAAINADTFYTNAPTKTVICQTLILRRLNSIVTASTVDSINGLRDVYVPSALKSSYEAATNWATRVNDGYITFHAIEGSIYENAYADGTPIT